MSSNDLPEKCKKRFKGVENFLRRVAFNLGNTPSQTEVKIISCIPIDVTDLQQKILCLEKQLDAVKNAEQSNEALQKSPVVQTALCRGTSNSTKRTGTLPTAQVERCEGCSMTRFPDESASSYPHKQVNCSCWSSDASYPEERETNLENRKGFFKKQKKKKEKPKKKDKGKTQLVYYAQTSNSPFTKYSDRAQTDNKTGDDGLALSRAYISEMIRKQYAPVPIIQDFSIASEISSPVCRDVENFDVKLNGNSDVCSCCYGPFHDLDEHLPRHNLANYCTDLPTCPVNNGFYDTDLYDLIPVKEKSTKTTKPYYESPRRKHNKSNVPRLYYPEFNRSRTNVQRHDTNYYGRAPAYVNYRTRRAPGRNSTKKENTNRIPPKTDRNDVRSNPTETSDSGCIDCGNVYIKHVLANNKPEIMKPTDPKTLKNAECLTMLLNDTECQTTTTQSVQIDQQLLEEKKTEETLNQIKTILQTVLTEVKTNSQLKKLAEDKSTKDAVVQKGSSQSNVPGGSTFMNSYTYSPYNMNPFLPSCSRQMTSGCCYPNMPYNATKCMHNFPVFIQTPGRGMCSSCYRNSSYIPRMSKMKQANTTATNTDKERSKETETLIKEIYKSMTMNMDFQAKDASASECDGLKSTPRISLNKSLYRPSVLDAGMRKFVQANASRNVQKPLTPLTSLESKLISNTRSMRSQIVSTTDTERRLRNRRLENYLETMDAQKRQYKIKEERNYKDVSPETTASDEDESTEVENDAYVPREETAKKTNPDVKANPVKKGLFRKMLKSVKLFSTKNKKKEEQIQVESDEEDEESEDNSEDYQTVYSQRVDRNPRYIPYPVRSVRSPHRIKAHSKISFSRHRRDRNHERSRKPYMEQEYRRHWNERFHENRNRYSSEEPCFGDNQRRSAYWRKYEARSALMGRLCQNRFVSVAPQTTIHTKIIRDESHEPEVSKAPRINPATKGLAWLKKHKLGIHCGPQWKKFILEG